MFDSIGQELFIEDLVVTTEVDFKTGALTIFRVTGFTQKKVVLERCRPTAKPKPIYKHSKRLLKLNVIFEAHLELLLQSDIHNTAKKFSQSVLETLENFQNDDGEIGKYMDVLSEIVKAEKIVLQDANKTLTT